jgi:hypothetical protein
VKPVRFAALEEILARAALRVAVIKSEC